MAFKIINIEKDTWEEKTSETGGTYRELDLSGQHLGARLEELPPNASSSVHHFHTLEEEHVIVLSGNATLFLGEEEIALTKSDHIWFAAGEEVAHHINNTSDAPFRFLVFGERKRGDVVVYPKDDVMAVKGTKQRLYKYTPWEGPKNS